MSVARRAFDMPVAEQYPVATVRRVALRSMR
jgi:hypothetical protein